MKLINKKFGPRKLKKYRKKHPMETWGNAPKQLRKSCRHKSDTVSTGKNWHLDWKNMLAACNGQTDENKRIKYAHPNNLSCDSYKNYLIQKNKLPIQCEGLIMNPLQIPAFPNLF